MSAVITNVRVAPVLASASLAAEQVTQLVLGEAARVIGTDADLLHVHTLLDDCSGWVHRGYLQLTSTGEADSWLVGAGWSTGAELEVSGARLRAPHRARLLIDGNERVRLPDGRPARIRTGRIQGIGEVIREAHLLSPAEWAWREFAGTPYLWGGVTDGGIDDTGLVQTTFLARGIPMPRMVGDQATLGTAVPLDQVASGDLLFFRGEDSDQIVEVAIAADADTIVHSTLATGQVTRESWTPGSRAASLRTRLVMVRRLT